MLSDQVYDVIDTTRARIVASGVATVRDEVRARTPLVAFSDDMREQSQVLKTFLLKKIPIATLRRCETTGRARQVVTELFAAYMERPAVPEAHGRQPHMARAEPWPTTSPA